METISVVIPVYNTERDLRRCLESLLRQTYKDFEVVLIDDGSTDGSGALCDSYAGADSRIRVFHTENGGVSEARNRGLHECRGQYIAFLDSDDYVDERYLERLYKAAQRYQADLVIGPHQVVAEDERGRIKQAFGRGWRYKLSGGRGKKEEERERILSREEAYGHMLRGGRMITSVWGKLYQRNLIQTIRYPQGEIYEDMKTMSDVVEASKRIAYIPYAGYYYVQRPGSITNGVISCEHLILLENERSLAALIWKKYPNLRGIMKRHYLRSCFFLFHGMAATEEGEVHCRALRRTILKEWKFLLFGKESTFIEGAMIFSLLPGTACYRQVKRLLRFFGKKSV